uniref:ascorbate ferrireductase (transmembrane) n=1 Tax=Opuntia streptacantha TaxID=393608 RepID=A0A7C8YXA2_OPUST
MKGSPRARPVTATVLAHLLAVAVIALVLVWLLHFREGLAFRSHVKPKIFNIHPLLMIIGVILIGGEAIMAYKTIPGEKRAQKRVHLILHLLALLIGAIGIYAVFKFHEELKIPHVYTLHSWLGIITIFLYTIQWLWSFLIFALPHSRTATRTAVAPWHVFGGMVIFVLAICTSLMGLGEKFIFSKLQRSQEALVVNFLGLLIILFGVSVIFGVSFSRL